MIEIEYVGGSNLPFSHWSELSTSHTWILFSVKWAPQKAQPILRIIASIPERKKQIHQHNPWGGLRLHKL